MFPLSPKVAGHFGILAVPSWKKVNRGNETLSSLMQLFLAAEATGASASCFFSCRHWFTFGGSGLKSARRETPPSSKRAARVGNPWPPVGNEPTSPPHAEESPECSVCLEDLLLGAPAWSPQQKAIRLKVHDSVPQPGAFLSFFFAWEGAPKIDYRKKRYPYSNLSTAGPR